MLSEAYALPVVAIPDGATAETELGGVYATVGAMATKRLAEPEPEPTEEPEAEAEPEAEPEAEAEAEPEAEAEAEAEAEPEAEAEAEAEPEAEAEEEAPAPAPEPEPLVADSKGWVISLESAETLSLLVELGVLPDKIIVLEAPAEEEGAEDALATLCVPLPSARLLVCSSARLLVCSSARLLVCSSACLLVC
jgi:outer membrane biosynthesis protein TonB